MYLLLGIILSFDPYEGHMILESGERIYVKPTAAIEAWDNRPMFLHYLKPGDMVQIELEPETEYLNSLFSRRIVLGPPKIADQTFIRVQESWVLDQGKRINDPLINNLGSKSFWVRERAMLTLKELSREEAYPLLLQASGSLDPEIRDRAAKLLNYHWFVEPDH